MHVAVGRITRRVKADCDTAVEELRQLALNAKERRVEIDDEVITATLAEWTEHGETELDHS